MFAAGILLGLLASVFARPAAAEIAPLEAGIAAYRDGDFATALDLFLLAQQSEESSSTLTFNLGLAYYRLGQYPQARANFEALTKDPEFAAVAEYHLGLVEAQSGNLESALAHFRTVDDEDSPPELRVLARTATQRLRPSAKARKTRGRLSLGGGYDSNPYLQSDTEPTRNDDGGGFLGQAQASVIYPLGSTVDPRYEIQGNLFLRNYVSDDDLDFYATELALRRRWKAGGWTGSIAGTGAETFLYGEHFQASGGINAEATRKLSRSTLGLRARVDSLHSIDTYDYLDGWRYRAEISDLVDLGWGFAGASYDLEWNDRRDLDIGEEFFSQSSQRHGITARLIHNLSERISLDWHARYRYNRYNDPHILIEEGTPASQRRVDDFAQFGLAARYRTSRSFSYVLDYRYSNNASSLERYDYDRHLILLALDWRF